MFTVRKCRCNCEKHVWEMYRTTDSLIHFWNMKIYQFLIVSKNRFQDMNQIKIFPLNHAA